MPNSKKKKPCNLSIELTDRFDYMYPNIRNLFLERALKLGLENKKFFEEVFFNPIFIEVK